MLTTDRAIPSRLFLRGFLHVRNRGPQARPPRDASDRVRNRADGPRPASTERQYSMRLGLKADAAGG